MVSGLPEHALLLRDFANTVDIDERTDALTDPASLAAWLRDHGLIAGSSPGAGAPGVDVGGDRAQADLETAIALRISLRSAMRSHHDAQAGAGGPSGLEAAAAGLALRLAESAGNPVLVPVERGVRGGLARLAAAIVASTADRSWDRLKICAEDTCQWAFLDSSKNRSRHWCSMRECGNRAKTRAYRARRAAAKSA